jgi:hypothetical protein
MAAGPAGPDGRIRTRTADGTLEILLRPLPAGRIAEIRTADGVMRGPDHEITITDCVGAPKPAGVAAAAGPELA